LLVDVSYWQLVGRFPMGGGSAEGAARAFGTGRVFVPIGALIVDFVLTISISVAAGVSALIAYLPALAPARIVFGLGLLVLVAGLTWFGHGGRLIFAVMTLLFVASAIAVLAHGYAHPAISHGRAPVTGAEGDPLFAVLFSFPVAMALATGTEAPSTAMAQLGQIGPADRRRFARGTLAATFVIVAGLTIGLAWLAVRLHVGIPGTRLHPDRRRGPRRGRQQPGLRAVPGTWPPGWLHCSTRPTAAGKPPTTYAGCTAKGSSFACPVITATNSPRSAGRSRCCSPRPTAASSPRA
jgi:hypothetical protein